MFRTKEGSTEQLVQLCAGYLVCYVIFGFVVKYFLLKMTGLQYLVYSTAGSNIICIGIVAGLRWFRLSSNKLITWGPVTFPSEYLYIIPSGLCTAVVIPTTTLMYTLPISIMVAMVMMRGSVIVISRVVDAVQIRQGILHKRVYWEENVAVVLALLAVSVNIFAGEEGGFEFLENAAAVSILGSYILAYLIRIYIMNYYKNTRPKGAPSDNKGFFAVEQIASSAFLMIATAMLIFFAPRVPAIVEFRDSFLEPHPLFVEAAISGLPFGLVAFFSVFIFMFKGRTATFAGLVNRLTSLIAGTIATLLFALTFGAKWPKGSEWASLVIILIAVAFLTRAERKRARELATEKV